MSFTVQGWCPGALRPMQSGDGLVVRVRPPLGRLTPEQAAGIATAAQRHGNGLIDLSGRANVQLRGVTAQTHPALIADLTALGLIDADVRAEARRNILITPFADAPTLRLAAELMRRLGELPDLPGKFGFALDCAAQRVLNDTPADIRLERAADGQLILRAEGADLGAQVSEDTAISALIALAQWFVAAGGVQDGRGRMARLIARGVRPDGGLTGTHAPAPALPPPSPGLTDHGALVGFEFGQMRAELLAVLASFGSLRITPWRMVLIEGAQTMPDLPGLITSNTPLLRIYACTGAPGCLQALQPTRDLARQLAPHLPGGAVLHVSGCAKGCAHPAPADLTLVATPDGFDLIAADTAQGTPLRRAVPLSEIPNLPEFR